VSERLLIFRISTEAMLLHGHCICKLTRCKLTSSRLDSHGLSSLLLVQSTSWLFCELTVHELVYPRVVQFWVTFRSQFWVTVPSEVYIKVRLVIT